MPPTFLVIGYGNSLRSDDGVGQIVATTVATWGMANVRSLAVHQLTPELSEELKSARYAIFVDAYRASEEGALVQVCPIEAVETGNFLLGHTSEPRSLLALTQAVYSYSPQAWLIKIPTVNFELGEHLSPIAQQGLTAALSEIRLLIKDKSCCFHSPFYLSPFPFSP